MKLTKIIRNIPHRQAGQVSRWPITIPPRPAALDIDKAEAKAMLAKGVERLAGCRRSSTRRTTGRCWSIFQAMDAAGKDGAIKHVMSGVNPQGVQVYSFKAPSAEELDHDFLWRIAKRCPSAGASASSIARTTRKCWWCACTRNSRRGRKCRASWSPRISGSSASRTSANSSAISRATACVVLKFFLHVSKEEQRKRFLARLEEPAKRWKFSMGDVAERERWDEYMAAYEDTIRHTSRRERRGTWCRPTQMVRAARGREADGRRDGELEARISEGRRGGAEGA